MRSYKHFRLMSMKPALAEDTETSPVQEKFAMVIEIMNFIIDVQRSKPWGVIF